MSRWPKPIIKEWKSWEEYRNDLRKLPQNYGVGGHAPADWSGGLNSIGDALAQSDRGWAEGMEYVHKLTAPVLDSVMGTMEGHEIVPDVFGGAFDVGEYMAGTPECWITLQHTNTKPCVTISMHTSTSGMIDSEILKIRGAAVTALTLALQQTGYATRVYAIDGGTVDDSGTIWIRTCLTDDFGGPLDVDRILFALAHPAASRQLAYGMEIALSPGGKEKMERGTICHLGWAREGGMSARPPEEWKSDLYLHASHWDDRDWRDPEQVAKWVKEMYATLTQGGESMEQIDPAASEKYI